MHKRKVKWAVPTNTHLKSRTSPVRLLHRFLISCVVELHLSVIATCTIPACLLSNLSKNNDREPQKHRNISPQIFSFSGLTGKMRGFVCIELEAICMKYNAKSPLFIAHYCKGDHCNAINVQKLNTCSDEKQV